jgi:hypothetical protein
MQGFHWLVRYIAERQQGRELPGSASPVLCSHPKRCCHLCFQVLLPKAAAQHLNNGQRNLGMFVYQLAKGCAIDLQHERRLERSHHRPVGSRLIIQDRHFAERFPLAEHGDLSL